METAASSTANPNSQAALTREDLIPGTFITCIDDFGRARTALVTHEPLTITEVGQLNLRHKPYLPCSEPNKVIVVQVARVLHPEEGNLLPYLEYWRLDEMGVIPTAAGWTGAYTVEEESMY